MSTRGLRLLITVALVFGVFMYFASAELNALMPVKSPLEGKLGGPVPGLTRWQLSKFEEGRALFEKKFSAEEGLGPLYNASSCIECHSEAEPAPGNAVLTEKAKETPPDNVADKNPAKNKAADAIKKDDSSKTAKPASSKSTASGGKVDLKVAASIAAKSDKRAVEVTAQAVQPKAALKAEPVFAELDSRTIYLIAKNAAHPPATAASAATPASVPGTPAAVPGTADLKALDNMIREGGPIIVRKSITDDPALASTLPAGCKMSAVAQLPAGVEQLSRRIPHQLYGLGFIESIPDAALNFTAARQAQVKDGPRGRAVHLPRSLSRCPQFGRFGSKDQYSLLMSYIANDMGVHLGVSNPLFRHTYSGSGLDEEPDCLKKIAKSEPNDNGADLLKINFYLTTLAPPPKPDSDMPAKQAAARGWVVFNRMQCGTCHAAEMQSPDKVFVLNPDGEPQDLMAAKEAAAVNPAGQFSFAQDHEPKYIELRALEHKIFKPYSDFLVHDMGRGLADGLAQEGTTGSEWRTAPLWGLRFRKFYLHDGRARTLEDAITAHGGDAESSAKQFKTLTDDEKKDLLKFLNSL